VFRLILDTPWMRELSVAEQRYQAVMAVIADGLSIAKVAGSGRWAGTSGPRMFGIGSCAGVIHLFRNAANCCREESKWDG